MIAHSIYQRIESSTRPGVAYIVKGDDVGSLTCSCPGARWRGMGRCKHTDAVAARLSAGAAGAALEAAIPAPVRVKKAKPVPPIPVDAIYFGITFGNRFQGAHPDLGDENLLASEGIIMPVDIFSELFF